MTSHGDYEDLPQFVQDLDDWCLRHMAYWGEVVTRPESITAAPGSMIQHLRGDLGSQEDDPLLDVNLAVLAWRALASAGEHAGLAHHAHQLSQGGVIPRPQMSLARGAMLSSARAVYLLQPDEQTERSVRAAQLANQEVRDARDYLKVLALGHPGDPGLDGLHAHFDAVKSAAANILTTAGGNPDSRTNETALLKAVAPVLGDGMEDPEFGVMSAWRKGSAVAHGRSWVWAALPDDAHPAQEFVTVWSVPVGLMGHAWKLWNLRRGVDSPPASPPPEWDLDPALWQGPSQVPRSVEVGAQVGAFAGWAVGRLLGAVRKPSRGQ